MFFANNDTRKALAVGSVVTVCGDDGAVKREFVIDRVAGSGGIAILYIAHEKDSPTRFIALKELFPNGLENAVARRREDGRIVINNPLVESEDADDEAYWKELEYFFEREIKMSQNAGMVYSADGEVCAQNSPDVLHVTGPLVATNGNRYMAVDTFSGESLTDFIDGGWTSKKAVGTAPNTRLGEILEILVKVTERLSALHGDSKMLHLDLSSANIYVTRRSGGNVLSPYIIDYGSAYDKGDDERELEAHRFTCNPFSAPEVTALARLQSQDESGYYVDETSDFYSVANILFYAVLGKVFTAEMLFDHSWKETLRAIYPAQVNESFADELIAFFGVGLATSQSERHENAKALIEDLKKLMQAYGKKRYLNKVKPDELMSYLLLERYPLYEYANANKEQKKLKDIDVLCLGSGEFVRSMILTMISTGQMIDYRLRLHVVSADVESCRRKLLELAPALADYSNICGEHVPNEYVSFEFAGVGDLLSPETYKQVAETYGYCRYIVISLGSNNKNIDMARLFAEEMNGRTREKIVIHYYMDEDAAQNVRSSVPEKNYGTKITLCPFSIGKYADVEETLGRRAFKVHYLYTKSFDPSAPKSAALEEFLGDDYAQKSSATAALHAKYKLASAGVKVTAKKPQKLNAIRTYLEYLENNKGRLLALEHRRWLMEKVAEKYTLPSLDTIRDYCFDTVDGEYVKGFRYPKKFYHHCLVPCGEDGIVLSRSAEEWDKYESFEEIDATDYDELDKVSLKMHLIAKRQLTQRKNRITKALEEIEGRIAEYDLSHDTVRELGEFKTWLNNAFASNNPYSYTARLKSLGAALSRDGVNVGDCITRMRCSLDLIDEFSKYKDYKEPDLAIIDNLLWLYYAGDSNIIIKPYSENQIDNIASALMLDAKEIYYYGCDGDDAVSGFFACRPDKIGVHWLKSSGADTAAVADELEKIIKQLKGNIIIDVTGSTEKMVAAAAFLAARCEVPVICCDTKKQHVEDILYFGEAPIYRLKNGISATEAFALLGAVANGDFESDYIERLGDRMEQMWELYSDHKNQWEMISAFFMSRGRCKSELYISNFTVQDNSEYVTYTYNNITRSQYTATGLDKFLERMVSFGLFRDVRFIENERTSAVSFKYPKNISGGTDIGKKLDFMFSEGLGFTRWVDKSVKHADNKFTLEFSSEMHVFTQEPTFTCPITRKVYQTIDMYPILCEMEQLGLISGLTDVAKLNFNYCYTAVKDCLAKAGNILEAYICHEAKKANYFDDVKANFSFNWSSGSNVKSEIDVILTKGLKTILVSAKTAKYNREHLEEIATLASHFVANTVPVIIYTSNKAYDGERVTNDISSVQARAREMGVYIVDSAVIAKGGLGEALIEIAEGRYPL